MGLSSSDRVAITDIRQSVLGGRLNAGNPGFQVYGNTGGHVSTRLPPAPKGQTYYEYRIGAAVAPAGGFAGVAGAAGMKRLVLLISESQQSDIVGEKVCYVAQAPPVPGPAFKAVGLPFSGDYPGILSLRQRKSEGTALPPLPLNDEDKAAYNYLNPVAGEEVRTATLTFPPGRYPRNSELPPGGGTKKLYFKRKLVTKYTIHQTYFSPDHYTSFSSV
jgi:hypothetical protein